MFNAVPKLFPIEMANAPLVRHSAWTLPNPLNPVIEVDAEFVGEKIPKEYNPAATMTIINMAQPYVIMYSKADCDLCIK